MNFTLQRLDPFGGGIPGDLYCEGQHDCVTLERVGYAIPAGRYQIVMTESGRAQAGSLWSPRPDHKLPLLLDVPGRTAIRVHALNDAEQSEGCIGVGKDRDGARIAHSRVALIAFMAKIDAAIALGEKVWIDVKDSA